VLGRLLRLAVTIVLLSTAVFVVSWLLVTPWIPRRLAWVPFDATAAGLAWLSIVSRAGR
jgi:hypothetical protein